VPFCIGALFGIGTRIVSSWKKVEKGKVEMSRLIFFAIHWGISMGGCPMNLAFFSASIMLFE
jgi:hypothetical protein